MTTLNKYKTLSAEDQLAELSMLNEDTSDKSSNDFFDDFHDKEMAYLENVFGTSAFDAYMESIA